MGYRLIEDFGAYRQPIASVVEVNGEKVLYRNITDRHYFKKPGYTALFTDEKVLQWVKANDPEVTSIVFDDGKKTLRTTLDRYLQARAVTMSGRRQRGLSVENFSQGEPLAIARPEEVRVITG